VNEYYCMVPSLIQELRQIAEKTTNWSQEVAGSMGKAPNFLVVEYRTRDSGALAFVVARTRDTYLAEFVNEVFIDRSKRNCNMVPLHAIEAPVPVGDDLDAAMDFVDVE
jgi:hypothetical protein